MSPETIQIGHRYFDAENNKIVTILSVGKKTPLVGVQPIGSKKFLWSHAESIQEMPVSSYLTSTDGGRAFIEALRPYEKNLYVKILPHKVEEFIKEYERITGEKLSVDTPGVCISGNQSKYGTEWSLRFKLPEGQTVNTFAFPVNANPRLLEEGEWFILNTNDFITELIQRHGFRLGRKDERSLS